MAKERREMRVRAAFALHLASAAALALAAAGLILVGHDKLPDWLVILALALLTAGYCYSGLPWWRRLDHMERDSWLLAWFWGGGFGGATALLATMVLTGIDSDWFKGALLVMGAQSTGHSLFQVAWRRLHRGAPS